MKLRNLLLILSLFIITAVSAEDNITNYYYEDFDLGHDPSDMSLLDIDQLPINAALDGTGLGAWHILKMNSTDTNFFMGSTSWFTTPGQANDWMITPAIKIYNTGTTLSWSSIVCDNSKKLDGYKVYVSTTGNKVSDFVDAPVFSIDADQSAYWAVHSVNLDQYVGEIVYIAFVNDSYDKYVLGIDNIKVAGPMALLDFEFTTPSMTDTGNENVRVDVTGNYDTPVNNCTVCYEVNGNIVKQDFTGLNIAKGETKTLVMDTPIEAALGETNNYTAWIEVDGDKYLPASCSLEGTAFVPNRHVLVEEGTGISCGYCPGGIVAMEYLEKWYPESFIGIAVHTTTTGLDPIAFEKYYSYLSFSGAPMGLFNRTTLTSPYVIEKTGDVYRYLLTGNGFEGQFLEALKTYPEAEVTGDAKYTKDGTTALIDMTISSKFVRNTDASDYLIAVVFTENNVTNPDGRLYLQHNYFYQGAEGIDVVGTKETMPNVGGFALKAENVPMEYNHVARAVVQDAFSGLTPGYPTEAIAGEEYSNALTLTMPEGVVNNIDNTSIVVILIRPDGTVANSCKLPLNPAGVGTIDSNNGLDVVVSDNIVNVKSVSAENVTVELYTAGGQKVYTQASSVDGSQTFDLGAQQSGVYVVKVSSAKSTVTRKVVL